MSPFSKLQSPSPHTHNFLDDYMHPLLWHHLQTDKLSPPPEPSSPILQAMPPILHESISSTEPEAKPKPYDDPLSAPTITHTSPLIVLTWTMTTHSMHSTNLHKNHFNLLTSITPSLLSYNPLIGLSYQSWKAIMVN